MNHWLILPILIPAVTAPLLIVSARYDTPLSRVFCVAANVVIGLVAIVLVHMVSTAGPQSYALGGWPAPYGIVIYADSLTAMMLLLAAMIGLVVSIAVMDGEDENGRYFHAIFLFQMMGINGAFLTADLFNLFVFFEVMLLASYALMVHGGGANRLRAGLQFVVLNLVGSTLFLIGVGLLYGACGSLNLADVAERVRELPTGQHQAMLTGVALMIGVFALKAALVPFHLWLPGTYREAPPLVTALFAVTTKVGIYAMLRMGFALDFWEPGTLFYSIGQWMLPAALVTVVVGGIGVVGARRLGEMAGYTVVASMGTILIGVATATEGTLVAAHYYLIHSTLAAALLYFVVALVQVNRGPASDSIRLGTWQRRSGLIGSCYFIAAVAIVGLPPLSGFIGKLLVLKSVQLQPAMIWTWSVLLGASLLMLLGLTRAGIMVFWTGQTQEQEPMHRPRGVLTLVASGIVAASLVGMTVGAAPLMEYLEHVVEHMLRGQS